MPFQTIDSFEVDSVSEHYTGETGGFEIAEAQASDGTHSLHGLPATVDSAIFSRPGDGLPYYPSEGDTIRWDQYSTGGTDDFYFGLGTEVGQNNYGIEFSGAGIWLYGYNGGTLLDINWYDISGTTHLNAWTHHELSWIVDETAGEATITYEISLDDGSVVHSSTDTETTALHQASGFGWGSNSAEQDVWWDNLRYFVDTTIDTGGTITANASPVSSTEYELFAISGVVDSEGSPIQGAVVYVTSPTTGRTFRTETDANGEYSVLVPLGYVYHVSAQYDDGSGQYAGTSYPYITYNL